MKSSIINYKPINFYKSFFSLFIKTLFVFVGGLLLFYVISNDTIKVNVLDNLYVSLLLFFFAAAIITVLNILIYSVYIYNVVIQDENLIILKWQKLKSFKEASISIKDFSVELKPSGKNTPYLELRLKFNDSKVEILKQTYYPVGWDKKNMREFVEKINKLKFG